MTLQKFYSYLPLQFQNLAISIFGIKWKKRRFGGIFNEELSKYKERESFKSDEWDTFKTTQLRNILEHAFLTVPFYKEKWGKSKIGLEDLKSISLNDLRKIPFLEKDELRKFGRNTLLSEKREPRGQFFSSSGSTGTPINVLFSYKMHQRWSAVIEARVRIWAGVSRLTPRGMIGGRRVVTEGDSKPPFYRYNYAEKQVYFSAYHISLKNVRDYVKGIKKYKANYMTGYAASNYLLAKFIQSENLTVPKMKAVITSSEKLTAEMRKVFKEVYNCNTYDGWSGVEACALVSECEHGSLHISEDAGIIEILDEHGNEVGPGESGEAICTGFLNYDQPLIRYRIGDCMTKGDKKCACGRNMPIIKEIDGRIEDVITGPDGRKMVRFHSIFTGFENILRSQIIQHSLNSIEVRVQTDIALTDQDKSTIKKRMISQLGEVTIEVNEVPEILQTKNGKYKAVISNLQIKI